ncbi:TonB family protein [Fibrisoma limi BUZ 3]|uniref:TonB family protein n=1 Tax=Fibrisoma limi BUZ 3 TaxID=1185876 RepID=I2GC78_9BACT|nr:energy transducer TonB [Fibrisoma limi]CCH51502.1 TonB family protein [Fibrisoma limi BUZ 3]
MRPLIFFLFLFVSLPLFAQKQAFKPFEVDKPAEPQGGTQYLDAFVQANLRKPISARSQNINGRVIIGAVIQADGSPTDVKVIKSLRPDCDREAIRVFSLYKNWSPARKADKQVSQEVTFPILFKPNQPFLYVNGATVSYYDKDFRELPDSTEQARYKQVSPMDSAGLPTADVVVFERKGKSWQEYNRLQLVQKDVKPLNRADKRRYMLGYQSTPGRWEGIVFEIDEAGIIRSQQSYEKGRPVGTSFTFDSSGVLQQKREEYDTQIVTTSWYPNGQLRQVLVSPLPKAKDGHAPGKIMGLWSNTGEHLVQEGNGLAVLSEPQRSEKDTAQQTLFVEKGQIVDGLKQGVWTGRYKDGSFFYEETYDKGICQGGKSIVAGSDTLRYTTLEKQPQFPGGMQALGQFLAQNLRYPAEAQKARAQGRVLVSFVVNTDGTLSDVHVLQGLGFGADEEALRVVNKSPRWEPGFQRGRRVRVRYALPINFTLH